MANSKADGSIIIDTELDNSGFEKGASGMQGALKRLTSGINSMGSQWRSSVEAATPAMQGLVNMSQEAASAMNDMDNSAAKGAQASAQTAADSFQKAGDAAEYFKNKMSDASTSKEFTTEVTSMGRSCDTLERQLAQLDASAQAGFTSDAQVDKFRSKIDQTKTTVSSLQEQLRALGQTQFSTKAYEDLSTSTAKAEQSLLKLYDKRDMLRELGVSENSQQWQRLTIQIQNAEAELDRYEQRMAAMRDNGTAFQTGANTEQYQTLRDRLSEAASSLREYEDTANNVSFSTESSGNAFAGFGEKVKSAAASALKLAGNLAKIPLNAVKTGLSKIASGLKSFISGSGKASSSSKGLLKSLTSLKTALISRLKRTFISEIFSEAKTAVQQLAKFSSDFNSSMSNIKNSMTELSANVGVSLGNLISAIEPVLTKIIDMISTAVTYLNAFFAMLGGKSTMTVAKKQTDSYADSLSSASSAAKDLKKQVYSFDELNKRTDNSSSGSGSSASDLFEEVPIDSVLPESVQEYLQSLQDAIANQDWNGLGLKLADGLNSLMKTIDDWINNVFRPKGIEWAKNVAEVLNGLVEGFDWELLGKTIADGINAIFDILNTFLTTFDFEALGRGFGQSINSIFANIDWELIGETLGNGFNAVTDTFYGLFSEIDWAAIGTDLSTGVNSMVETIDFDKAVTTVMLGLNGIMSSISSFFAGVNWAELGAKLTSGLAKVFTEFDYAGLGTMFNNVLVAMFDFAIGALGGYDWYSLGQTIATGIGDALNAVNWTELAAKLGASITLLGTAIVQSLLGALQSAATSLSEHFSSIGEDSIAGFFKGVSDALADASNWIKENITDPIVNWVKEKFGIHSPSTVFADIGKNVILGLYNGIKSKFSSITSLFTTKIADIKSKVTTKWNEIKESTSTTWENIKTTISDKLSSAQTSASEQTDKMKSTLTTSWNDIKSSASTTWASIKSTITDKLSETKTSLSTTSDNIKSTISNAWDNINSTASTKWPTIKSTITNSFNDTKTSLNTTTESVKSAISTAWDNVKSTASTKWSNIKTTVVNLWNSLKTTLSSTDWSSVGTNLVNGLKNGITNAWSSLTTKVSSLASSLTSALKHKFQIQSPSKVWAQIGAYLDAGLENGIGDNEKSVITTASNLAKNVTAAVEGTNATLDVGLGDASAVSELSTISDKLSDIVTTFQAIGDALSGVSLQVPDIAAGTVVPYKTKISASETPTDDSVTQLSEGMDERLADVTYLLRQMLSALQGLNLNIDADSLTQVISTMQRRTTRSYGGA